MALPPIISDGSVTLTFGAAGVYYGYCTIADVGFEFPNRTSFTTLSNSVIAQEITYAAQEFQNLIARLYQMPYVGADGGILLTFRNINAKLATANLIDRYFQGSEPNLSPAGAERRAYAEEYISDIINGTLVLSPPIGDAQSLSEAVVYPTASAATITPNPYLSSPAEMTPIFTISRDKFRDNLM